METLCRKDCQYFSTYTETCDYTLIMYESRGCPTSACTKYMPRVSKRSWDKYRRNASGERRESAVHTPEPPTEPNFIERYVVADCGHEVYEGEYLYERDDARTMCTECLEDFIDALTISEKAELIGCEASVISFDRGY